MGVSTIVKSMTGSGRGVENWDLDYILRLVWAELSQTASEVLFFMVKNAEYTLVCVCGCVSILCGTTQKCFGRTSGMATWLFSRSSPLLPVTGAKFLRFTLLLTSLLTHNMDQ